MESAGTHKTSFASPDTPDVTGEAQAGTAGAQAGTAGAPTVIGNTPAVTGTTLVRRSNVPLMWLVFLAGTGSMAVEICASRLLAPYYGSSTIVWANIIGLVLASLSLGYWLGGRWADRRPSHRLLGGIVLAAAVLVAAVPFAARPILDFSVHALDSVSAGAIVGSLLGSVALFVPPVLLLGMVTPFAIRLAVTGVDDAGRVAGRVFALSTAGSLLGTFLPALLFIPLVGTQRTLLGAAALLSLAAAILLGRWWVIAGVLVAGLLFVPPGVVKAQPGLLFEGESRYQFVQVVRSGDVRYLYLNEGQAIHSVWRRDTVYTGGEWDMFLTLPALIGRLPRRAATLGNAGGTTARAYGALFPATRIDGVEIDPLVTKAARRYFGLNDNKRLTVFTQDARPFLLRQQLDASSGDQGSARYDLIMIDAYRQPYVPFYLTTQEFFRLCRQRLAPGGAVALNVTTLPGDTRLSHAIAGTLATEFPQVVTWRALNFNTLVVGLTQRAPMSELRARLRSTIGAANGDLAPEEVRLLTGLMAGQLRVAAPAEDPWTDDHAPVEWLTDRMIVSYGARGGSLGEHLLPTAP
jgi:spermidine synthase